MRHCIRRDIQRRPSRPCCALQHCLKFKGHVQWCFGDNVRGQQASSIEASASAVAFSPCSAPVIGREAVAVSRIATGVIAQMGRSRSLFTTCARLRLCGVVAARAGRATIEGAEHGAERPQRRCTFWCRSHPPYFGYSTGCGAVSSIRTERDRV